MHAMYRAYSQEIPTHWKMFSALQNELIFFDPLNSKEKKNSEEFFVTRPGFEPRLSEPESEVLPLYYRAIKNELL